MKRSLSVNVVENTFVPKHVSWSASVLIEGVPKVAYGSSEEEAVQKLSTRLQDDFHRGARTVELEVPSVVPGSSRGV